MAWWLGVGRSTRPAWFPKELAGVRAGGRSSQIYCRCNRQTNEKWQLIRIVVHHVDSHRQSLHHFYEIARRVLRRQQGQRGAGTHGETRDASLEVRFAAIHVHLQVYALANSQIAKLCFLEICVDPDVAQRADRHETFTNLDVIAGIDIAAGDNAVDLRNDCAVTQVELRFFQIALRLQQVRVGLF